MPVLKRPAAAQVPAVAQKRQAVRRRLQIHVCGIDGRTLELKRDSEDPVSAVKQAVAKQWGVPSSCQKLAHEVKLVRDSDNIGKYCASTEDTVRFSFVVTLEAVCKQLAGSKKDDSVRAQALEDLRKLGLKGANAIAPVCSCLYDACPKVRTSALATLRKISTDQRHVIDSIVESFAEWVTPDSPSFTGKMDWAIKVLRAFAENENNHAVTAVIAMVVRLPIFEKEWCAGVLKGIAQDQCHAADMLLAALVQQDASLGAKALPDAEDVLDSFIYSRAPKQFKTDDILVHVVTAITNYLETPDEKTQLNALLLLPRFGNDCFAETDPSKWNDATQRLHSRLMTTIVDITHNRASSDKLVEAALRALKSILLKSDAELTARIVTLIDIAGKEAINCAALKVLRRCAERGDESVIAAASALLTSRSNKVKTSAMKALSCLVDYQHEEDEDSYSYDGDFSDF